MLSDSWHSFRVGAAALGRLETNKKCNYGRICHQVWAMHRIIIFFMSAHQYENCIAMLHWSFKCTPNEWNATVPVWHNIAFYADTQPNAKCTVNSLSRQPTSIRTISRRQSNKSARKTKLCLYKLMQPLWIWIKSHEYVPPFLIPCDSSTFWPLSTRTT